MKGTPLVVFFFLVCIAVLFAFQNCSRLMRSDSVVFPQTLDEIQFRKDQVTINRITGSATLNIWVSAKDSVISKSNGVITSVASINSGGLPLSATLDAPEVVLSSSGASLFSLPGGSLLATNPPQGLASSEASLILVVEPPLSGGLARLASGGYTEALTIEYAPAAGAIPAFIRAVHYYDETNYESLSMPAPINTALVIAASFGNKLASLSLQVNGVVATGSVQAQGSVIPSSNILRELTIGDNAGSMRFGELMALTQQLSPAELNTMSRYLGDKWRVHVGFDASLYPPDTGLESGDMLPLEVSQAIKSNCTASCHTHEVWLGFKASDFKSTLTSYGAKLVTPGDFLNSELYTRIKNSEGVSISSAGKSMPADGNTVSPSDQVTIRNWIQNLK